MKFKESKKRGRKGLNKINFPRDKILEEISLNRKRLIVQKKALTRGEG